MTLYHATYRAAFRRIAVAPLLAGVAAVIGISPAQAQAQTQAQPEVKVEHAAARLVVIAEPRSNISVTVQHGPSGLPPLSVRREGGRIVVDGGLQRPDGGTTIHCVGGYSKTTPFSFFGHPVDHVRESRAVVVPGVGRVEFGDLPVITAHVPLDANISTSGAVWGDVGATYSLSLAATGCGDWSAGPVRGVFSLASAGSGDVRASDVGRLYARLAGSGDLSVGDAGATAVQIASSGGVSAASVTGGLDAAVASSGDLAVGRMDGPVHAQIAGSGDIRLKSGRAPDVKVQVSGSGDFNFAGTAGRLQAAVAGSGDVHVAHVTGEVSKSVAGSGEVTVGN